MRAPIGPRAFYHCESLAEIEFGLGGTGDLSFAERAFWGCTSLKTLNLPNRLRGVENDYDAFQFGLKLAGGLSNPNAVMCFSEYDGRDCAAVESINVEEGGLYFSSYDGALYTAGRKMLVFCPQQKSGTITIAKEAETFRVGCFWNCQILSAIEFEEGGTGGFRVAVGKRQLHLYDGRYLLQLLQSYLHSFPRASRKNRRQRAFIGARRLPDARIITFQS